MIKTVIPQYYLDIPEKVIESEKNLNIRWCYDENISKCTWQDDACYICLLLLSAFIIIIFFIIDLPRIYKRTPFGTYQIYFK